jgi:feruloyl-CoA hydratase/lyase
VLEIAHKLLKKNPYTVKATKDAVRRTREMTYQNAEEYLIRAQEGLNWHDKSDGRHVAMKQFLDDKTFKPGLGTYDTTKAR